ncbi:hypothetical protein L5515_009152 [Caenorhabditis briggsae]|uniref:F-box domain-containing protein n=1 Tax=Caenorhabditis briggsae TaxID=6238 RepID=A0AAE9F9K0_CAEBR|nr:hypothetical protein L5515_009152 [Caenorhabditis briggsae]
MDHLDFRSILRMRKVCHDLRNFIDEVVPSSHMTRIIVTVRPYDVELILEDSKTEARYTTIYAHRNVWNDLDIILKHQKGVTNMFYLSLYSMRDDMMIDNEVCEKAHSEFLNQLHNNLVSRKYSLKVANMRFLTISLEFLRHLIEVLLNNQSLKFFSLEYETYYESEELKSWFEILFDGNRPHNSHHQIWYSIIPGSERNFLEMEAVHTSLLYFSRASLS